ncbi:LOW QUALITY PROTEIN: hypothetical protein KUTeg_018390 [Tegillarca granosa]|uniref:FERM domain-containing protein n=1 Tax=Tegillarca granosa TaxID=220873 RepID=A0ABQ9EHQ4_TEGGR|nr:LOW QUALITY PROTEIN: hypothetical protein KUTeg_018390 [Tegillarca granosa]
MGEPRAVNRRVEQVRSARMVICRVLMLDGTYYETQIDKRAVGLTLFDTVCDSVDLLEKDYFGLSYTDPSLPTVKLWLNHEKKISKQMKGLPWEFAFEVKFYPGDPQQLHEDLTRYQLCLQLRNDIVCGKLPCSVVTYTLLGSYTVQSELGDFDVEEYGPGIEYLKDMQFAPNQDRELLQKIAELHKTHRGQTPEEAELHFLENAKKLALYGVQLQDAKDAFGVDIQIGVCASGIIIFQDKLQINKFVWPKVIKMSYRRNKFYVKLRAGEFEDFQSQIGFRLLNVKLAKILWKICVEHHSFFRFRESEAPKKREMYKRRPPRETEPPPPPRPQYIDDNHYPEKRHPVDEQEYSDREREGYGSEDDSPIDRKSRLEKIHAVPTPLSMVLNREKREHHENNVDEPPRYNHRYDDEDSLPEKHHHEDDEDVMNNNVMHSVELDTNTFILFNMELTSHDFESVDTISYFYYIKMILFQFIFLKCNWYRYMYMQSMCFERAIDAPTSHNEPQPRHEEEPPQGPPRALLSKKEIKRLEKEEKAKLKKEKEEAKKRKKAEEKELKKLEKTRKKSGKEKQQDIGRDWQEAMAVASSPIPHDSDEDEKPRRLNRLHSFEEQKVSPPEDDDKDREEVHDDDYEGDRDKHRHSDREDEEASGSDEEHKSSSDSKPVEKEAEVDQARAGEEFDL